jgi:acyl-CoA synthetase (AMP-forming)/AMP-acid ligase II
VPHLDSGLMRAVRIQSANADPDRPAIIDGGDSSQTLSHDRLAAGVDEVAATLPPVTSGRRLVQVPLSAEVDTIIGYLAVLLAGHVALVTTDHADTITARYRPDLLLRPGATFEPLSPIAQHLLHPDLALLLSTSGSTGSPKLVRLSNENLLSNADAIIAALAITPTDRAITSLPLHYCFGLSVLHSQLRAGATVVLRTRSFADPELGDALVRARISIIAATPHLIDLLDVQGVLQRDLPDLRLIAQAGGALPPNRVSTIAARGQEAGWSLVVMYGQTEATARMAVLPPERVAADPDAVGWPVANSTFRLDTAVPEATSGANPIGELIFAGPGVMLGYAEHPDDLALGRMQDELRTGDLARIDADGLVRIVGRRADFVKIMGIRIDLGQIERHLRAAAILACVTATDDQLQVTYQVAKSLAADRVRALTATASGLGQSVISVQGVETLPRLSNGKTDRVACASAHRTQRDRLPSAWAVRRKQPADLSAVVAALAPLLGTEAVDPNRSFVELGGDSFSHVEASLRLGRLLGDLPVDWHHRPLRELPQSAEQAPRRLYGQRVETHVLLRAAAVIMICGSHVGLFPLAGGAHVLLAVAGFSFGRYVLAEPSTIQRWRRLARAVIGVAVPAVLVAVAMLTIFGSAHWANVTLVHWALRPGVGNIFWFVEALLLIMIATTALLSIQRLRAAYASDPWRAGMILTLILLIPRYIVLATMDGLIRGLPWTVAWLFTAGLAMASAQTRSRRFVTAAVAAGATIGFFPVVERNLVIMIGLVLLALVSSLVVPKIIVGPIGVIAAASLHIYLVQFQLFAFFSTPALKFAGALAAGLAFWSVSTSLLRRLQWSVPLIATPAQTPAEHLRLRKDYLCVDVRS